MANQLKKFTKHLENNAKNQTSIMPVLFMGHGSPMNAIESNIFTKGWQSISQKIEKPKAILCISAHWETRGTQITAMPNPRTIHDFGGFPQALFDVEYGVPGNPELAGTIKQNAMPTIIDLDYQWGLDHGAWSVIMQMYPNADVPVIQMSLDLNKSPKFHYELAKELKFLRTQGVLIVGSGNIVHNLGRMDWANMNKTNHGYDWAIETNTRIKEFILNKDHQSLIHFDKMGKAFQLSIPTPEHYLPLLYALALQEENEETNFFNDVLVGGSISMASIIIGKN